MEAMCHTTKQCNINLSGKQKGVRWGEIEKEGKIKAKGGRKGVRGERGKETRIGEKKK